MSIVTVDKTYYTVDPLYQWDKNQVLEVRGLSLPFIPEIHYSNAGMDKAIVRQATVDAAGVITADVPNSLLQSASKITACICGYEGETFKTLYIISIPVTARSKPADYVIESTDSEVYSFNKLENQIANLVSAMSDEDATGNYELIDMRIGVDGIVYTSAGEAVRQQIQAVINMCTGVDVRVLELEEEVNNLTFKVNNLPLVETDPVELSYNTYEGNSVGSDGQRHSNGGYTLCMCTAITEGNTYVVSGSGNAYADSTGLVVAPLFVFLTSSGEVVSYEPGTEDAQPVYIADYEVVAPEGATMLFVNHYNEHDAVKVIEKAKKVLIGMDELSDEVKGSLERVPELGEDIIDLDGRVMETETEIEALKSGLGYHQTKSKNLLNVTNGTYGGDVFNVTGEDNYFSIGGTFREGLSSNKNVILPTFTVPENGSYTFTAYADEDYIDADGNQGFRATLARASDGNQVTTMYIAKTGTHIRTISLEVDEEYYIKIGTGTASSAVSVGALFENVKFKLQIEIGAESTDWEDPTLSVESCELYENVEKLKDDVEKINVSLEDTVIMCLGDSIMYGAGNNGVGIGELLISGVSATLYDYSQGGATIGYRTSSADGTTDYTNGSKQNITYQAELAVAQSVAPNYILINGGTNDIGTLNISLGEISSGYSAELDKSSFSGGLEYIFDILKRAYPSACIMYIRDHNMGSRDYTKQVTYGNRALEICEKWSIPVVNVFRDSGLNTNLAEMHMYTFSSESFPNGDRTHPNEEGYNKFYIPLIKAEIRRRK